MSQINLTGPFHNKLTFDKSKIRKNIIMPTYNQARRLTNIYASLIKEFLEEGCSTSAKYFQFLIEKERKLYESTVIRDRISDEPKLLLGLFDNCKIAEKAALLGKCNGPVVCSRLLLQCILLLERSDNKYNWILMDVFRIITKICTNVCKDINISKESLCQIYYKFGLFLIKADLAEAVNYLEKSFELAKGTNWENPEQLIKEKSIYYSSIIANSFAEALLKYGTQIVRNNPDKAVKMAQKALVVIMAADFENNKIMYINIHLDMADFYIQASYFELSLKTLNNIIKYIKPNASENLEYSSFLSRYYHLKGVSYERLKLYDRALNELQESLKIIRKLNIKPSEGQILIDIAKVYMALGRSQFSMAESHLKQSKEIFVQINDIFNIKKTSYLMANLKVQTIQPMILDLIKNSSFVYCDKHRLRRWKFTCLPFWRNLHRTLEEEAQDPLQCLILPTQMKQNNK